MNLLGTRVAGKYELIKFLGEGGLGRVFLATQHPMNRQVALKLLHPEFSSDASISARFEREALAASKVSHPNSVVIHDFGTDLIDNKKQLYLVMEFLSGETLHDKIQTAPGRGLSAKEAVHILGQALRPLDAFHKAGVVHRDLKPDNIMICKSDGGEHVKLLDFGIAKVSGSSLTATGQMIGTPHYMAPEQITAKKDLGLEVDIYAMGVLLYEALTGDPPYMADTHIDIFRLHLTGSPRPLVEVFPGEQGLAPFDAVVQKSMAKQPKDRYASAEEMRQALEAALVASENADKTQSMPRISLPDYETTVKMGSLRFDETEKMVTQPRPPEPTMLLQDEIAPKNDVAIGLWGKIRRFFVRAR
jgi:serine/threonine protein kinase